MSQGLRQGSDDCSFQLDVITQLLLMQGLSYATEQCSLQQTLNQN